MTVKNQDIKFLFKKMLFPIAFIFPFVFSMGVCSEIGAARACIATVILSLFIDEFNSKSMIPVLLNFAVISFIYSVFGETATILSLIVSGIVLCFGYKLNNILSKFKDSSIAIGIIIATALVVTVLQTTNYFGIGATGNTAREMIQSYVSLGFHGNWRGVLYGTIVMVIMITFPRKFKKLNKTVHASAIALLLTLVLNYFLNPSDMITSINEVKSLDFEFGSDFNISAWGIVFSILCGIITGLSNTVLLSKDECSNKDYVTTGIVNVLLSPFFCFIPQKINKSFVKNIPVALTTALIIFLIKDLIIRMPVHSCAVVLIVGAWQAIEWKKLKYAFNNPLTVISFIIPIIIFLIF